MKAIATVFALVAVSGCASLQAPPPLVMAESSSPNPLKDAFARLHAQQALYLDRAYALHGDVAWVQGLSIASSIATLGFAAYDAHKDNILAAALTAAIANTANTQLAPGSAEAFYMRGVTTLTCISNSARELYFEGGDDGYVMPSAATREYREHREELLNLRAVGDEYIEQAQSSLARALADTKAPAKEADIKNLRAAAAKTSSAQLNKLTAAISRAEAADSKLQLGINAQRKLVPTINKAMEDLHVLVTKRQTPELKSLLDGIAKIEIPKPAPATKSAASATAPQLEKLGNNFGFKFGIELNAVEQSADEIISQIDRLVREVDDMAPENDEAAIKRINACVVTFGAAS